MPDHDAPVLPARPDRRPDRTTAVLAAVLVPLVVATVVGLALLWPRGETPRSGVVAVDTSFTTGVVTATAAEQCQGSDEDRRPDGTIPAEVECLRVTARVAVDGGAAREVDVWAPATLRAQDVGPGTRVVLERFAPTGTEPEAWAWHDFARALPLTALAVAFAVVVVAVAGLRGARALVGLVLAFGVVAGFMLPALLQGRDALAVGLVGSAAIMVPVLYLAHGVSRRTTTALLGTFAGLAVTAALGAVAARAAHLSGISTEEGYRLAMLTGQLEGTALRELFLCGVVLAGLGVLNDVTITQASAVWELRAADPSAGRVELVRRGMRIGRDHIASTVYTIAFAYAGAALPVLLLLEVYRLPVLLTIGSGEFAEEIARTLVGSIGLVLAIPLTTAIAAAVVTAGPPQRARHAHATGHSHGAMPTAATNGAVG